MNQQQPEKEKLSFKIGLSGLYWGKNPQYSIAMDNQIIVENFIRVPSNKTIYHEFDIEVQHDTEYCLQISLLNKTDEDTVLNDQNEIIKDMLLNIEYIEIDGIELEILKWTESVFVPTDPLRPIIKECVNLGWNGAYQLKFLSPFYLWLLEKS